MSVMVTQYISSFSGFSLSTDWPHGRVTVHTCAVRSPLNGYQVTSRPRARFLRYSKWLDTFWTDLVVVWFFVVNIHSDCSGRPGTKL